MLKVTRYDVGKLPRGTILVKCTHANMWWWEERNMDVGQHMIFIRCSGPLARVEHPETGRRYKVSWSNYINDEGYINIKSNCIFDE